MDREKLKDILRILVRKGLITIHTDVKDKSEVLESLKASVNGLTESPEYKSSLALYEELYKRINSFEYKHRAKLNSDWESQILRSASSILLNISEGYGRSQGFLVSFYLIGRGSAYETLSNLTISSFADLKPQCEQVIKDIEKKLVDVII